MRIALCLFGIPRCSRVTIPSLEANVLAPLKACGELKVFYHLYRQSRVVNPRSGEEGGLAAENYDFAAAYEGLLESPEDGPDQALAAELSAFGNAFDDQGGSLRNLLLQLHSLHRVTRLAQAWDPDVCAFARPDLLYHDRLHEAIVRHAARHPLACAIPDWQWWSGRNDRFAVCGKAIYPPYGARLDRALVYCQDGPRPLAPETLLRFVLLENKAQVLGMPTRATRVRLQGRLEFEEFAAGKRAGKGLRCQVAMRMAQARYRWAMFKGAWAGKRIEEAGHDAG
jgi:hypothetical protein